MKLRNSFRWEEGQAIPENLSAIQVTGEEKEVQRKATYPRLP